MEHKKLEQDRTEQNEKSMYTPQYESDACGIGFIANIKGAKSHQIVQDALTMLENMEHRGAIGSDPETGDGAGILIQVPDKFFRIELKKLGLNYPLLVNMVLEWFIFLATLNLETNAASY
jgi:glutamate synthase (NADPH/NADH) large chain